MKRILITVLITIFCFGVGATSFAVNDLASLNDWYKTEVKPVTEQGHHKNKAEKHVNKNHKDKKGDQENNAVNNQS